MSLLEDFFRDLDAAWDLESPRVRLPLFGSGALMLQTSYQRATKDTDIFETFEQTASIKERLENLAGKGTPLHGRYRMYLEIVSNGVPFLPHVPRWHAHALRLQHFGLEVLDVVDVVVSKLARFSAQDRDDIDAMIERGLVPHARLLERFRDAVDERTTDARADQLPLYVRRFHEVERDMLGVDETEITLPSWI